MRTTSFILVAFWVIVAGCEKPEEQTELEKRNSELQEQLASRDQFIEDISSTINEIHDKIGTVWEMEKNVMGKPSSSEVQQTMSQAEVKDLILNRISDIQAVLNENRKKVAGLQKKLNASSVKYAGLEKIVDDLKKSIEVREKSIADLQIRVQDLEGEVTQKTQTIAMNEAIINSQTNQIETQSKEINTAYYVMGNKDELKEKGIITDEGGFLWGLLGSTTVMSPAVDENGFYPLDKSMDNEIDVPGNIDQIIPKRDQKYYVTEAAEGNRTVLKITDPAFWRDRRLVIVTNNTN